MNYLTYSAKILSVPIFVVLIFSVPQIRAQESVGYLKTMSDYLDYDEENGFFKFTEKQRSSSDKIGRPLEKIIYLKASIITSIEIVEIDQVPTLRITTSEIVPGKGAFVNKVYNFEIKQDFKKVERKIDSLLGRVDKQVLHRIE